MGAPTTMRLGDAEVWVAELADGRLGFVAGQATCPADGDVVVLTAADRRVSGPARVVRSGPAYEEVRGRLRVDAGRWQRWRLRRDHPVVLVALTSS